jgi:outer membrane protein TolC
MKYKIYVIFILIFLNTAVFAQGVLTFEGAISTALHKNHSIQVARNDAEMAQNNVHIGNAGMLPSVSVSASSNYSDTDLANVPANQKSTTNNAQVSASYTLFDGFGNINRFKRLQVLGEIGSLQARSNIEFTLYQVSNAYYGAALAFENLNIAKELTAISSERLQRAKKKSQFGQANTIEVLAAQVDLNSDSVLVTQAQLNWDEAKRNLNVLLNRGISTNFTVESAVNFPENISLTDVQTAAKNQNAAFLVNKNLLKNSEYELKMARSARIPRVDLSSSYAYNQTKSDLKVGLDEPNKILRVGAIASLNLFNGFQTNINIQNAKIELENQQLLEEEARLELERDITNAFEAYQNSRLVLSLEEQNLHAAELNFKRTEELYNLGQVTNTQFREAQLNLVRAKNSISSAKYSAKLDEIELLRLSGRLINKQ